MGVVKTALSHLSSDIVTCKGEFVCGIIRGMGANLPIEQRRNLAKQIFTWAGERPADARSPVDCYYIRETNSYASYYNNDNHSSNKNNNNNNGNKMFSPDELSLHAPPIVETVDIQRNQGLIEPWIRRMEPVLLVGPEGCGKTLLLSKRIKLLFFF